MTLDSDNHTTLAVIGSKLDGVDEKLDGVLDRLDGLDLRVRSSENKIVEHEQKLGTWAAGQAFLSMILAGIAAFIGTRN
jgi:hypothetical protein